MLSQKLYWKALSVLLLVALLSSLGTASTPAAAQGSTPPNRFQTEHVRPIAKVDPAAFTNRIAKNGPTKVVIELKDDPAAVVYANSLKATGQNAAGRESVSQVDRIQQVQKDLINAITAPSIGAQVIYSVQRAYNGVAVKVDPGKLTEIASMDSVKAIHPLITKVLDNSYSVPLIGAPQVWSLTTPYKGDGIRIGVIDTGIDYLHTNFGGPGTGYATGDFTKIGSGFPSAKVVGGYDFAGDAYDANSTDPKNAAVPDPNPMDCNGHGSHVSGTIAGLGVNMDGTTYAGPYTSSVDYTKLNIGPGVAPDAKLYALRVFGCEGSTDLTDQAIDWAMDPNGDGNLNDHLDVINMSLGSSYGSTYDSSAVASDNAAKAGVVVVASAGNSGDTYYITGSPSTATRAISVASSQDAGDIALLDKLPINSPDSLKGDIFASEASFGPDITGKPVTGDLAYVTTGADGKDNTLGCNAFAAGAFTGKIALISRGTCTFTAKVKNAQNAGAIGVLLYNSVIGAPGAMGGSDSTITIPAMMTYKSTGTTLVNAIKGGATVNITLTFANRDQRIDNGPIPGNIDLISSFTSRGPRRIDSFLKPDITAPGDTIFSTAALTGNLGVSMSGTSMAAPHMTGVMALLRQIHPNWTVEELKALAMNTAIHDTNTGGASPVNYGPGRQGPGRVDAFAASQDNVVLYNDMDQGAVSVSFGQVDVSKKLTVTKTVTVANKGTSDATYTASFEDRTKVDGVSFQLLDMGGTALTNVAVAAGSTFQFKVQMTADPAVMTHTKDATVAKTQTYYREYLSEASGLIKLTPVAGTVLRLPVHAVPRPVAAMRASSRTATLTGFTGSFDISLTGTPVNTTNKGAVKPPTGIVSLVTALELAEVSPNENMFTNDPKLEAALDAADLKYIGIGTDAPATTIDKAGIYFGVATYGKWSSPNDTEFDIYIDTNHDGQPDFIVFNSNLTSASGGSNPGDDFMTAIVDVAQNAIVDVGDCINYLCANSADTAVFNNNVMVLPVYAAQLGLDATHTKFSYLVRTYSRESVTSGPVDVSSWLTYDIAHPALDMTGGAAGSPTYSDEPGTTATPNTIPVKFDASLSAAKPPKGVLLLHHHNGEDANTGVSTAEVVNLSFPQDNPPTVVTPIPTPEMAKPTAPFTFTVPANTFTDPDTGDVLTLSATLADGSPLPKWLTFDAKTGTFSGTPTTADMGTYTVRVFATDPMGASTFTDFTLEVLGSYFLPIISR